MKKNLLVLLFVAFGFQAFNQNLTLSNAGGPLPNGSSFMVNGDQNFFMAAYVFVTNNSNNAKDVMVKKTEIFLIQGTSNYFCWAQCYGPNTYISPEALTINAGETNDVNFSGDYDPMGHVGVTTIMYTFFDGNNPNDSAAVTVYFNAGYTGIGDLAAVDMISDVYPNPAYGSANIDYNFPVSATDASLVVRTLTGQVVSSYDLNGNQGNIKMDVSSFNPGVYFCSLQINGMEVKTSKLIVQ
jgi:hypothetical protein